MEDSKLAMRILPSPNWRERGNAVLKYVVIHGTWMASDDEAIARLRDPAAEVSSHYVITREGELVQLVSEKYSAFHAGKSRWDGVENLNDWSIGIEIGNRGPFPHGATLESEKQVSDWTNAEPYTEAQYVTLIALLKDIQSRHPAVTPHNVLGHSDISPGRKTDPGEHFDWNRLVNAGVCQRDIP
jgi:N-acetylmuramoyl-L-alanine amidase